LEAEELKIAFVTRKFQSGLPERMVEIFKKYTDWDAVGLVPGIWNSKVYRGGSFNSSNKQNEALGLYWIEDKDYLNHHLDTADVIYIFDSTSLPDLGRMDLLSKKTCVWHLSTKWGPGFGHLFPENEVGRYRLIVLCEGWNRYDMGGLDWNHLPILIPIENPLFNSTPITSRFKYASMAPRAKTNFGRDGVLIAAPRCYQEIKVALQGIPFKPLTNRPYRACIESKASSWVGIDDVVNPLTHGSGMEYLALGVPCINRVDENLEQLFKTVTGSNRLPFIDSDLKSLPDVVKNCLLTPVDVWEQCCVETRSWYEKYLHPRDLVKRYIEAIA
jgi:hypothetical protein